jgi:hypothetical protein
LSVAKTDRHIKASMTEKSVVELSTDRHTASLQQNLRHVVAASLMRRQLEEDEEVFDV